MNEEVYKKVIDCTILRCEVGSGLYGLKLSGICDCGHDSIKATVATSGGCHADNCASMVIRGDRDELGICLEPIDMAMGFSEFEQFVYRTAAEREGQHDAPSKDGDLDLTIYSLRKFLRLALSGNPTIIQLLFVDKSKWVAGTVVGEELQKLSPYIVARSSGKAFLGYLQAQRMRLTGERGGSHGAVHSEDQEKYGYDTKYAVHMLRLGYQGIELLSKGSLVFPVPEPERSFLLRVRRGESNLNQILTTCGELEKELKSLLDHSPLQATPDREYVERWMVDQYAKKWLAEERPHLEWCRVCDQKVDPDCRGCGGSGVNLVR